MANRRSSDPSRDGEERGRGPGRPRDPERDTAILEAALELMAREGYARMSIAQVARAAGVSKPTVYRRWSGKPDLATSALASFALSEPPVEGDTARARLVSALGNFRRSLLRPHGMAMLGTLLAEEAHNPELLELFRERIVAARRERLTAILEEGRAQGDIRRDADLEAAVSLLVGSFYARYLTGRGVDEGWPERVVALLWPALEE